VLFGIFAKHSPESCPLNNKTSKKMFLEIEDKIKENSKKFGITKVIGFYMSVLEHEWIIIVDAKNAHEIESLCIAVGISSISRVKIVPMNDFRVVLNKIKLQNH
jgi:hypothetical protein